MHMLWYLLVVLTLLWQTPALWSAPAASYSVMPLETLDTVGIARGSDDVLRLRLVNGQGHTIIGRDPETDLGVLPGGIYTIGWRLQHGRVAGYASTGEAGRLVHAFRYTAADGLVDLGTAGDPALFSAATSLNTTHVAGYGTHPTRDCVIPLLWPDGQPGQVLPTLAGGCGVVQAMNEQGVRVGGATDGRGIWHVVRWPVAGGIDDLGTQGGHWGVGLDINASGVIIGIVVSEQGQQQGFVAQGAGASPVVLAPLPGDTQTFVRSLNDTGDSVGSSTRPDMTGKELQHAQLAFWGLDGTPVDLSLRVANASGWEFQQGLGISNSGLIVGLGTYNGVPTGFLLVPQPGPVVPEPPRARERSRQRGR